MLTYLVQRRYGCFRPFLDLGDLGDTATKVISKFRQMKSLNMPVYAAQFPCHVTVEVISLLVGLGRDVTLVLIT